MDLATLPNLGFNWNDALEMLQTTGVEFAINLGKGLLIFLVGKLVVRLLVRAMRNIMQSRDVDQTLESFASSLVRMVLMVFVIIAAISAIGVQTASFVAILGAAGLAVGLALQGSLANFASGVLIVLFRPYKVGDYIEAAGVSGTVVAVEILSTVFKTPDNKSVIVPNGQVMGGVITNYSANELRRVDLVVGVSYGDDIDKVRAILEDLIAADDRIVDEPAHTIAVSALADSSVNFVVRPWVSSGDYWAVTFDLTEAIKKRFDKEGVTIPFPQQDVHLYPATSD